MARNEFQIETKASKRSFACPDCRKRFVSASAMSMHINAMHKKPLPKGHRPIVVDAFPIKPKKNRWFTRLLTFGLLGK